MESLARLATRRPVAVTVLAVAVALVGWISWRQLPIDLLPDLQSPTIVVSVRSGDRPPVEMERLYGERVEQSLFTVQGIRELTQVARTGRLIATVVFDWGVDMDLAQIDVQKAVGPLSGDLNVDEVLVRRFDPRQAPILTLGLAAPSGQPDLIDLRRLARRQVAPALERLDGVAEVRVLGGREEEVRVELDRYRLEARGISISEVENRLREANVDIGAGTLEEGNQVYLVRGLSRFRSSRDVEQVVIAYRQDSRGSRSPVRVSDVAQVSFAPREVDHLVRVDGGEGVGLGVYKEAGANTVQVSRTVRDALGGLDEDLPGIEVQVVSDEAALVEDAIADVQTAALIGIVLAVLVLAFFLRSAAATVIVASAVPVSLLAALFFMRFGGYSLNLMTLAGLALGAGMLVDNAIVVVESIFRRREMGDGPTDAAVRGTAAVAGAIVASTLTTCVVFLPVLFVQGLAARLIEGIAFAVVTSLVASLAVAVLLIPALARWLVGRRGESADSSADSAIEEDDGEAAPRGPAAWVEARVAQLLGAPGLVVLVAAIAVGGAFWLLRGLGTELLPPADPRQFSLRLVGPPGQRVESTAATAAALESVLREAADGGVEAIQSEIGRLPEDERLITTELTEENTGRIRVRLAEGAGSGSELVARLAPALEDLPGTDIAWEVGASALARALGTSGPPVALEVAGDSLVDLRQAVEALAEQLRSSEAVWDVQTSFQGGPPELRVILDRSIADGLGVDLLTIGRVLEATLDGREVTELVTGDEERQVVLRLPSPRRETLGEVRFRTAAGARLTLGEVARFEPAEGAREIYRRDQRRVARVTAQVAPGFAAPEAREAAQSALDEVSMPPGLVSRMAGEEAERVETFAELRWAAGLALLLVLMVLAGTFESFLQPFTVLAAVPLALVGVAVALVPLGQPIGVMAMLGLIVLAGVAVNDAILLLATARRQMERGVERRRALARAAGIRLRPILMTTLTTVLALLPLAFGSGEAARLRSPMAIAIIGGILASTVASLLVVPCLYLLLDRLRPGGGAAPS